MPPKEWLSKLALAVPNPPRDGRDFAERATVIVFAASMPDGAWCEATLRLAMRTFRLWPSAAEVSTLLADWWSDHRPDRFERSSWSALAPPEPRATATDEERAHVRAVAAEAVAALTRSRPPGAPDGPGALPLAPDALLRHYQEAAELKRKRGEKWPAGEARIAALKRAVGAPR